MWGWYVVATQPGREVLAARHLENQDFRIFLPTCRRIVRHARRKSAIESPLFPGYLFVALDPAVNRWRSINGTVGVRYLVSAGGSPLALPFGFVEALRESIDRDGSPSMASGLEVGGAVALMSGPFADRIGLLDRLDSNGRVRVLLDLMSTIVPVETNALNLMPA